MTEEPRWLTDREQRAWQAYRRMFLLLNAQLARDLGQDSGLSEPDYDVLSSLGSSPRYRRRISDLADHMLWSRSRLSHHLARMEKRGLVVREECDTDGRGAIVALTEDGLRTLGEAAPLHVQSVRRNFIDLLDSDQIDAFAGIGERVVHRLTHTAGGQ
ncbi:MarR family winged helix-turn-helix transcriptional regulator [Streptomyces sp. H39-S7]|uniref:MarR family winged helix-turn-helix transcriptional regulator n=1 Tax=Streptomyces sp. H39-S7 TaxID=3004357 RepID=UPI0022AFFF0A|nr:MarR family winged helix-turn-helix transcriptional regulator [Streptomyces sp. H39-S7]MCZ4122784.1 MarR family winged helix-turn-helix transcriptional regulator [Streptomyces sp. H39-S7]